MRSIVMAAAAVAAAAALTGCASQSDRPARAAVEMVPDGEPITCVQTNRIRNTEVIDDSTIDFIMNDGTIFRNSLPNSCPGLGFERSFTYATSINQLCNVSIITVVNQGGGLRLGASCGLGLFQPVKPRQTAK